MRNYNVVIFYFINDAKQGHTSNIVTYSLRLICQAASPNFYPPPTISATQISYCSSIVLKKNDNYLGNSWILGL